MATYPIDETVIVGDPEHVEHHIALSQGVNDLNARLTGQEAKFRAFDSQSAADAASPFPPGTWILIKAT